jgi:hypothetical protein
MTLLSRGTVVDGLLHGRVHLFRGDQHDGLKLQGPRGIHGQSDGGGGHTIGPVDNDEKIVAAVGLIKGFKRSPRVLD